MSTKNKKKGDEREKKKKGNYWSGFKLFFPRHGGAMAWRE